MVKDKKILVSLTVTLLFLLSGCSSNKRETVSFPKDDLGNPKRDVIVINSEEMELPDFKNTIDEDKKMHTVNVKEQKDGTVVVALPQGRPTNNWYIEEKEEIKLVSYNTESLDGKKRDKPEGGSDEIQTFTFITSLNLIRFKWVNINQSGKSFEDKSESYKLDVVISE